MPKTGLILRSAGIDEHEGSTVMRGVLQNDTMQYLNIDSYQRELLSQKARASIFDALEKGDRLPDVELGMRGESYTDLGNNVFRLNDPVFTIDGRQRTSSVMEFLTEQPLKPIRLGCMVSFNTTRDWEAARFKILNTRRVRVSPNVILRNDREKHNSMLVLYGLSMNTPDCPLYKRVQWGNAMNRHEIISATTFAASALLLMGHHAQSRTSKQPDRIGVELDTVADRITLELFRANLVEFINTVDEIWGLREIAYGGPTPWVKSTFLYVLAGLFSDHFDFWKSEDPRRLQIPHTIKNKLRTFKVLDPHVVMLAGASSRSTHVMLYGHLRDYINSGKRTGHLRSRYASPASKKPPPPPSFDEESEEAIPT